MSRPGQAQNQRSSPRRLTTQELAERWGVSVGGLRKLVAKGEIPSAAYFKVGRSVRFREEAIQTLEKGCA